MFFELAAGAVNEGHPREHFTSPFGMVFEEFVQRSLERMFPPFGVHRPIEYERHGKLLSPQMLFSISPLTSHSSRLSHVVRALPL